MDIQVSQQEGRVPVTVLRLTGELTADTATDFENVALAAIRDGTRRMLLDLTDVPFIGSFGLRSLNRVLMALVNAGEGQSEAELRQGVRSGRTKSVHLKLANPNPQVMKVLETSGFDMLLEVHRNVKDGVASF
jgi:anti-anti-sigma factor